MQPDTSQRPPASSTKWWAMLGIGLGVLMSTLDASIVNISLPTLVRQLDTDFATIQWVVLSYLLIITSLMLSVARLGDMLGKRKVYLTGLVLFTTGSLLCGLSPGVGWLIGFRALQGTGAVMLTALGTAIITEVFPPSERGRALGIMGSVVSVGIAIGPMVGGVLIGLVGWRSVFLVNVPIGLATFFIVGRVVPPLPPGEGRQRFDVAGGLIMFVVLGCYALGMTLGQGTGFQDGRIVALLAASGLGLIAFLAVEARVRQPMIDLRMFRNVLFSINLLMGFLVFILIGGTFIMPFFLELVQGYPTEQVGLMMTIYPVMMGTVAPVAGVLSDRFGSRVISLIGLVLIAAASLLISTLYEGISVIGYLLRLAPLGIGMGMFQSPNNSAIMGTAPREKLGVASGLLALTRTLGQTTGLPLIGTLFTAQVMAFETLPPGGDVSQASPAALVQGVNGTFRVAALFIFAATLLAAAALWIDRRRGGEKDLRPAEAR
jgi:EmrB/QacA subfamily drug resistance transporter